MIFLLLVTGCLVGVKQNNRLIVNDPIPLKQSAAGVVRIATNDKIPLIVEGLSDASFEEDIGGDVVVKPGWYAALVDCWNEHHENRVNQVKE